MKLFKTLILLFFACASLQAQIGSSDKEAELKNETGINTENWELGAVFYREGIVYVSTQTTKLRYAVEDTNIGQGIMSIWKADRNSEGKLENPMPFAKELLTDVHENGVTFNSTGETIYFTRNNEQSTSNTSNNGLKQLSIYSAQNTGGTWENINEMSFNEAGYNTKHPTVHPDLDELYFSSDRAGGYGGYDIYVVRKIGGEWSSPINLGPAVNTPNDEEFPFIHPDNTLYFSSDGHAGLGQRDIYYTTKNREIWKRPVNMGEPYNSSSDDFAFILDRDERNGYLTSDRKGGQGTFDIYSFKMTDTKPTGSDEILVSVIDGSTNQSITGAKVSYVNLNEVVVPGNGTGDLRIDRLNGSDNEFVFKVKTKDDDDAGLTDEEGKYFLNISDGQYALSVSKQGYLPYQIQFTVPSSGNDNNTYLVPLDKAADCVPFSGKVSTGTFAQTGATVIIKDADSGQEFRVITDTDGNYEYCLPCGREYQVIAQKGGGSSGSMQISTLDRPCDEDFVLRQKDIKLPGGRSLANGGGGGGDGIGGYDYGLDENGNPIASGPIRVGTTILLPNIYYNFDDADLRPDATSDLDLVKKMLEVYPEMEIELISHTDSRGTDEYNQQLSERRSRRVVDYLAEMGVDVNRVTPVGMGERNPRNRCVNGRKCSEADHRENRRTEVKVTSIGTVSSSMQTDESVEQLSDYTIDESGNDSYDYNNTSTSSSSNTYQDRSGKPYYVIAGTFRSDTNAKTRLDKVQNLGFYNAEIIQFDYPSYHAICVEKFSSENEARDLVSTLQSEFGVDSYVRRME
ncbi:MAG: OmpA family protein [Bacteroidota bacterium]